MNTKDLHLDGVLLARKWVEIAIIEGKSESVIQMYQRLLDFAIEQYQKLEGK